jgi:hypothetical protein
LNLKKQAYSKTLDSDLEEVRETFFLCLLDIIFCIEFYTVIPRNSGFKKKSVTLSLSLSLSNYTADKLIYLLSLSVLLILKDCAHTIYHPVIEGVNNAFSIQINCCRHNLVLFLKEKTTYYQSNVFVGRIDRQFHHSSNFLEIAILKT